MAPITREMLRLYLEDALPEHEMAMIEKSLRDSAELRNLLNEVRELEDRGEHSIGAIWRRARVSCLSQGQLGGYLLEALDPDLCDYIQFHLQVIGCPYCQANLEDLQKRQADSEPLRKRRRRIIDSSAGVLKNVMRP